MIWVYFVGLIAVEKAQRVHAILPRGEKRKVKGIKGMGGDGDEDGDGDENGDETGT